jgi:biotin carboxyl carrier protein
MVMARGGCARKVRMPEIRIVTEVAGRVCTLPVQAGSAVNEGDDVAFAAGTIKSILVNLDEVVAEGQPLVILEV